MDGGTPLTRFEIVSCYRCPSTLREGPVTPTEHHGPASPVTARVRLQLLRLGHVVDDALSHQVTRRLIRHEPHSSQTRSRARGRHSDSSQRFLHVAGEFFWTRTQSWLVG